jgi:hypothetical protein
MRKEGSTCTCGDFCALGLPERIPKRPINLTYSKTILCLARIIFIVGVLEIVCLIPCYYREVFCAVESTSFVSMPCVD